MRWPSYIGLCLILLSIQVTFASFLAIGGARPDLLFLPVLYSALGPHERKDALFRSALAGLFNDLLSSGQFGLYLALYTLAGALFLIMREYFLRETPVAEFAFIFSVSFLVNLAYGFVGVGISRAGLLGTVKFAGAIALYTSLVAIVLFGVRKKLRPIIGV